MKILIPSRRDAAERNAPYIQNGQLVVHSGKANVHVLHKLLQPNAHVYCEVPVGEGGRTHAVSVFRPDQRLPALVFSPGYPRPQKGEKPSDVTPFDSVKYMEVFTKTECVSAISVCDEARVSAIALTP